MSGSSFLDALLDPGVQALGGMAQGFAQAAMPTRLPTPFGAVLGMGAGGLAQGAGRGLEMQRAAMQNRVAASALPAELAKNQMLANFWQHPEQIQQMMGGGAPFGAPAPASPGNPVQPSPASIGGGGAAGAANPSIQPLVSAAAAKYGIPEPLANAYLQQESSLGTNPAANGNIGQITFKTAANPGYGMQPLAGADLTDPAKNIDFSMQYLRKAGDAAGVKDWNDPAQWGTALKAYNGGGDPNYVQNVARFLPKSTMIPGGVTQGSFQVAQAGNGAVPVPSGAGPVAQPSPQVGAPGGIPKSPEEALAMAQQYEQRANDLERQQATAKFFQAQGVPAFAPPGDAGALRQAAAAARNLAFTTPKAQWEEAVKLQYAAPIAAAQANAAIPATLAGKGFSLGPNGTQQFVPGSAADPSYISQSEFAKPQVLRPGSMLPVPPGAMPAMPGGGFLKNPELREVTDPATGQKSYVHINPASPFAPPGTAGEASPVNVAGTGGQQQPAVAAVSPQIAHAREQAVTDFVGKDSDAYQAAQNTQAWLHQIDHAADTMSAAGPLYMTGPHAELRLGVMSNINDMARSLGIKEPFDQNAVASWEEMKKATTTAGFELSSHYEGHARQAAQTIMNATSAVPAQTNSPVGQKLVSAGIREGAQSAIDLHNYRQQMMNETQGGDKFVSAENDFYQAHPAEQYAQRAISTLHPVKITDPAQFSKYLPGTYALLPNGKLVQVPARPDAPPIPAYLQQAPQQ